MHQLRTMHTHILLVEDDYDLASSLIEYLELDNIICEHASNGAMGFELARVGNYDVILLDVMLPRMDGFTVCQHLRKEGIDTPVLILTARDSLEDKIEGFEAGTDDYLIKPFAMKELLFRIKSLTKRRSSQARKYSIKDLIINTETMTVTRNDIKIKLTPTEFIILEVLAKANPQVVSRRDLIKNIWGEDSPESNSLKVHIHKLRQKIDKNYSTKLLQTIPSLGFALREDNEKT